MDLNTILIILGVVALVALVAHGVWSNRREKSRYFQNEHQFSKSVVPQTKVPQETSQVTSNVQHTHHQSEPQAPTQQALNFEDVHSTVNYTSPSEVENIEQAVNQITISLPNNPQPIETSVENKPSAPTNLAMATIADLERVMDAEEGFNSSSAELREQLAEASLQAGSSSFTTSAKQNNIKLEPSVSIPMEEQEEEKEQYNESAVNNDFIMLYIVAPENRDFNGVELDKALDALGFIYGEGKIYHRHLDLNIATPVLFSVANIQQPGTFDLANLADFYTMGIVLFMPLPSQHGKDITNLRLMIRVAKNMAEDLGGVILTDTQEIFNEQAESAYLARVA